VTASPDVTVRDHRDGQFDGRDRHDGRYDGRYDDDSVQYDYTTYDDSGFRRDDAGNYWRGSDRYIRSQGQQHWMQLGTASGGTSLIRVGADAGRFSTLRLDVSGMMRIQKVVVRFANGHTREFSTRAMMNGRRNAPLTIDLLGEKRQIVSVRIVASQFSRGTVSVAALQTPRLNWRRYVAQY
jgi:hypothetical protein